MKRGVGGLFICTSVFLAVSLALTWVPIASAQEITGAIKANIFDKSGGSVPKATVELSGPALLAPRRLGSDEAGHVFFDQVPPGEYTLTVSAPNFTTYKLAGIKLNVGKLPTFDVTLEVGQITTTVEVTAPSVLVVDVTASNVSTAIPKDVIDNIPKGRSYQSLIPYAPGARQEPLQSKRTDRGRQNGFQIDGASDSENTYLVEGLDTSEVESGGIKQNVVFEFVQEVQVKTSGLAAEYGGAMGGVVNVIQERGSNQFHGELLSYLRSNAFDSNDPCATTPQASPEGIGANTPVGTQINCGLRQQAGTSVAASTRTDSPAEFYQEKQDHYRIISPGFKVGGPIFKDKLWFVTSYIPDVDRTSRTVKFVGKINPGIRTFTRTQTTQNMYNRLDYQPFTKLHLFGSWTYGYYRIAGQLPSLPDSLTGQINTAATSDPTLNRPDTGSVNPANIMNFGGEWTPNAHTVVTARYGYFYYNTSDRGKPQGIRYSYEEPLAIGGGSPTAGCPQGTTGTHDLKGCSLIPTATSPGASFAAASFQNIAPNQQTLFDIFSRKSFSTDFSYFVSKWGTHNFKVGYSFNRLYNNVNIGFNTARINVFWGDSYPPLTPAGTSSCTAINAQNGAPGCRGNMGYFTIMDGVDTAGEASSLNHGIYVQDSWTIGRGLTLNLGVRVDKEYLPPYSPGFPDINFDFGSKVAPRIGGAYDLFHNGKVKIFADYAKFYDIMKYSLPRGSWGGDYWHDCSYTLDFFDFNTITPTAPAGHACQTSGPAAGVSVGRFIENQNWRAASPILKADPIVDPNMKPASQHEMILGTDWAITPNLGLEVRYARKRLDNTIEDMSIDDSTYYIGNPGSAFSDLLRRPLIAAAYASSPSDPVLCATCPHQPPATRRYDGVETRFTYRHGASLFGQVAYTWSRLTGNYSGLTDTEILDGNGGRHNANNNRSFDLPEMQYSTTGKVTDGPLATDRPNTLTMTGYYRVKWWKVATTFGANQNISQGTPKSACIPVIDSTSSCMYWDRRGEFPVMHRDAATGNFVLDSVTHGARTPKFAQTDLNIGNEIGVSKTNEAMKIGFEFNVTNLLNNASVLSYNPNPLAGPPSNEFLKFDSATNPAGYNFPAALSGFDPIALINSEGTGTSNLSLNSSGAPTTNTLVYNNRYGQPILIQNRRTIRLAIRFTF